MTLREDFRSGNLLPHEECEKVRALVESYLNGNRDEVHEIFHLSEKPMLVGLHFFLELYQADKVAASSFIHRIAEEARSSKVQIG